ncbi:DUF6221 family protein [Nocardia fluminea]|uniref:DUF6221 family protein n=1 Tax=Nocardia fluminea TaxID=134984 RepID=UPI0036606EB8
MTIEEFIEARLAEDEQTANTAGTGIYARWDYLPDDGTTSRDYTYGEVYAPDSVRVHRYGAGDNQRESREYWRVTNDSEGLTPAVEPEQGHHIARHDPDRVVHEASAWRAVLEFGKALVSASQQVEFETYVLPPIAAIWHNHPDYQPEWNTP